MKKASEYLASVTLELGGKSPVIFDQNCDLEKSVESIVWGKFINAGQTCVAPDHIYIPTSLELAFKEQVKLTWKKFLDHKASGFTSIITQKHWARLRDLVTEAKSQNGIKVEVLDGVSEDQKNRTYPLTLVTGEMKGIRVNEEEIFGPILPIKLYQSIDEVLHEIQSQDYPLALYIFSNQESFVKKVLSETRSGGVCVNDVVLHLANPYLPFGGVGASGIGNYHGFYGFRAFSHERAIFEPSRFGQKFRFFYPPYSIEKFNFLKKIMKIV
jgi:aldehyde dehydrogenase (NAD+)